MLLTFLEEKESVARDLVLMAFSLIPFPLNLIHFSSTLNPLCSDFYTTYVLHTYFYTTFILLSDWGVCGFSLQLWMQR